MAITQTEIEQLYNLPFLSLMFKAQQVHRDNFKDNDIELCTLLNIKTGACPEDCGYCSQSGHYQTELQKEKLMDIDSVIEQAKIAKANGSKRFCMGAAWRSPPKKMLPQVLEMIKKVKEIGLETCVTLGMLDEEQVQALKNAGLDYYNHNIDTSPEYYQKIITTRTFQSRIDTLKLIGEHDINVCCGGIIGMGENREDRLAFLYELANLAHPPKSVPINRLTPIKGTPLGDAPPIDNIEFIRVIAVTRIILPQSMIRLSAGRAGMSEEMQTLCFMAGANSMWLGEKLLTVKNNNTDQDIQLLNKLGMNQTLNQLCA